MLAIKEDILNSDLSLQNELKKLSLEQPDSWRKMGVKSRPNIHSLLRYPAMMMPSMQSNILDCILNYVPENSYIFDPFVGSGTVLTEATLRCLDFVGVDINPLAILVCQVKAIIDQKIEFKDIAEQVVENFKNDTSELIDVDFPRREKWFLDSSAIILSKLRRAIQTINSLEARKILWVIFAETIRQTSNSRTSTYKLHIRKIEKYIPADQIVKIFEEHLKNVVNQIGEYHQNKIEFRESSNINLILSDIRTAELTYQNRHQILVTSPPYGDNQTTIPYGQFSYLSLKWIPLEDLPEGTSQFSFLNSNSIDKDSLGGVLKDITLKEEFLVDLSPTYRELIDYVKKHEKIDRYRKVTSFMYDFYQALIHIKSTSKTAHWIFTTGNRTVANITVPFDEILEDMVKALGGQIVTSITRKLPGKRMPARNNFSKTINNEVTLIAEFK